MSDLIKLFSTYIWSCFQTRERLKAEIIVLRHQLNILRRHAPKRPRVSGSDRAIFVWLYRLFPRLADAIRIIRPATIVGWHRAGFRAWWRWKCRRRVGRPKAVFEIRSLIRQMCLENPLWGAPRIHGELLLLGFSVAQSTVSKYMLRSPRRPSQGWRTFLRNHADAIVSIDLLTVPTIAFEQLYVLVILRHLRREIVRVAVTRHPTAEWLARQLTEAFPWDTAPAILIRDNDKAFGEVFKRRVASMGIRDHPVTPRSPWQNGYAERVIGSIRRECLDHMIVFGAEHLQRVPNAYARYYNSARTHLALDKNAPFSRQISRLGVIQSRPHLSGLHHEYVRI